MFKHISIKLRITILTATVLIACCVGLTIVLNFSATHLVLSIKPAEDNTALQSPRREPNQPFIKIEDAKHEFRKESFLYMFVIVIIGSTLSYFVAGKALKPLHHLNNQVKKINVHNLSDPLDVPQTNDEIADLTHSFNEITNKLCEAFLIQQRFSVSAAHELRTPLAVLQTKLDVFKKKNEHTIAEYDAIIMAFEKQIHRLRALVLNLLDLTYMNDDNEKSMVSMRDLLEDIVSELSAISVEKNITLSLKCDNSEVYGNPDLLYRAFYNVVENAIRYNTSDGEVDIEVNKIEKRKCQIFIKDTGIGIPSEKKKHIFEPFYRVDTSRSRAMGGAGLGLSIVDHIIKKHDGTIEVFDNPHGGTCVRIVI